MLPALPAIGQGRSPGDRSAASVLRWRAMARSALRNGIVLAGLAVAVALVRAGPARGAGPRLRPLDGTARAAVRCAGQRARADARRTGDGRRPPSRARRGADARARPRRPSSRRTASTFPPGSTPRAGRRPATHPVKAKLKSGIYHLPGMLNYDRTVPDRCYRDAEAAEADGLRTAKR